MEGIIRAARGRAISTGALDYAYARPALRVLIARDGRQVNTP